MHQHTLLDSAPKSKLISPSDSLTLCGIYRFYFSEIRGLAPEIQTRVDRLCSTHAASYCMPYIVYHLLPVCMDCSDPLAFTPLVRTTICLIRVEAKWYLDGVLWSNAATDKHAKVSPPPQSNSRLVLCSASCCSYRNLHLEAPNDALDADTRCFFGDIEQE
jgi:hypothetical protein